MQHLINSTGAPFALSACVSMPPRLGKHLVPVHRGALPAPGLVLLAPHEPQSPAPNCESLSCRNVGADGGSLLLWLTLAWSPTQQAHQALVLEWNSTNQAVTLLDPTFGISSAELCRRKGKERKVEMGSGGNNPNQMF